MYIGPLHDRTFLNSLLIHLKEPETPALYGTHARMLGMSTVISEVSSKRVVWWEK
jgi:hypothetical protein